MWKSSGILLVIILAAAAGYLAHVVQIESTDIRLFADSKINASYPDLIAIILTVFGVIMAIASIGLATAAIIGWNSIEGKAMKTAGEAIRGDINDVNGKLHKLIKDAITDTKSPFHLTLKREMQIMIFNGVLSFDAPSQNEEEDGDEHHQ